MSLVCGLLVAFASIFRVSQLERRGEQQHARTMEAESSCGSCPNNWCVRRRRSARRSPGNCTTKSVKCSPGCGWNSGVSRRCTARPAGEFPARIGQGRILLDQALQSVRDIAMGLRPSMLDDLGLEAALQWQARDFCRRNDIPVNVEVRAPLGDLQDRSKNKSVPDHSGGADAIARSTPKLDRSRLSSKQVKDDLRVTIRDDGVGLKAGATERVWD